MLFINDSSSISESADVSSAEEGVFRVQRYQEQFMTISDICCLEECIMILNNTLVKRMHSSEEASSQIK